MLVVSADPQRDDSSVLRTTPIYVAALYKTSTQLPGRCSNQDYYTFQLRCVGCSRLLVSSDASNHHPTYQNRGFPGSGRLVLLGRFLLPLDSH